MSPLVDVGLRFSHFYQSDRHGSIYRLERAEALSTSLQWQNYALFQKTTRRTSSAKATWDARLYREILKGVLTKRPVIVIWHTLLLLKSSGSPSLLDPIGEGLCLKTLNYNFPSHKCKSQVFTAWTKYQKQILSGRFQLAGSVGTNTGLPI